MARAYTRGNGFTGNVPNNELAAAITTASARLAANARQISHSEQTGSLGIDVRNGFVGWSTAELAC